MTTSTPGRRWWRRWRWRHLLVDGPELAAIALLAAAVTLWGIPTRGAAGGDAAPFGLGLGYGCILAGRLVVRALRLPAERFGGIPAVVLVGFLALNTLLLLAALAFPFALTTDALLVAAGVVGWAAWGDPPAARPPSSASASASGVGCLALSLVAATLWSIDSIEPTIASRGFLFFRPWADSWTHACFIRACRDMHGIGSLEHFSMVGEPAPFYHYASFLVPALLAATTGVTCYLAYATLLVPLGMALTGLAAYVLGRWAWGPGAGLAATVGVLLIPDASRYGLANPFLGYHWLAETGPTLAYGIAMIAVAWVLVLEGCRAGRPGVVAAGFAAAGLAVAFKAHLFVANAFLIWAYPAFFLRGVAPRARWAWLVVAVATFAVAVRASWRLPGVPLLKLDGSGLKRHLAAVIANLDGVELRQVLAVGPATSRAHDLLAGFVHLTFGTFGAFALAWPIGAALLLRGAGGAGGADRRARAEAALFPALVTANYLVMAMGLALDDRTNHMPEELLHRPLVWAYFAVAAWTLGCLYECILKVPLARPGPARLLAPAALVALLGVPFYCGQGVQVGPGWGKQFTWMREPLGFVRCAEFLRDHSARGDVVQNSREDRWIVLGALAERPVYVASTWQVQRQADERIIRRLDEMARFRGLTDPAEVAAFAARRRIAWYVLDPATRVAWPGSIRDHPAFEAGGFRVYRFAPAG